MLRSTSTGSLPPAMQVKICGVTTPTELRLLEQAGVNYAGLWFGMPQGRYSLERDSLLTLARAPLARLRCIGVTTASEPEQIADVVRGTGMAGVQLHGFQLPRMVQSLKQRLDDRLELFKVLHVQAGKCLEQPLLRQYAASGVDAFILDNFISRRQPGSTGERIPTTVVAELVELLGAERLFLAGGMDAERIRVLRAGWPLRGVDIDTGARNPAGIDPQRVRAIVAAAGASQE